MYKLTKRFTSRDGRLEVDSREYGMTEDGLSQIIGVEKHLGGATHIYAKTEGGSSNKFIASTRDGQHNIPFDEKPESGWANFSLEHGSAYNPSRGEEGWWNVQVADAPSEVAKGIGLPFSWHVSTFLIFTWDEGGEGENGGGDTGGGEEGELPEIVSVETIINFSDGSSQSFVVTASEG